MVLQGQVGCVVQVHNPPLRDGPPPEADDLGDEPRALGQNPSRPYCDYSTDDPPKEKKACRWSVFRKSSPLLEKLLRLSIVDRSQPALSRLI
jgi:hypothetical protein